MMMDIQMAVITATTLGMMAIGIFTLKHTNVH